MERAGRGTGVKQMHPGSAMDGVSVLGLCTPATSASSVAGEGISPRVHHFPVPCESTTRHP